jgi:hypothetical protein
MRTTFRSGVPVVAFVALVAMASAAGAATQWSVQSSRNPGEGNILYGVDATSATSAWAVG